MRRIIENGDVYHIFDQSVTPQKWKWHVCVCRVQYLFLRVNSNPVWQPNFPLSADEHGFLLHDSYVELNQLVRFSEREVRPRQFIGRLSRVCLNRLALAARDARTLTPDQKDAIFDNLYQG